MKVPSKLHWNCSHTSCYCCSLADEAFLLNTPIHLLSFKSFFNFWHIQLFSFGRDLERERKNSFLHTFRKAAFCSAEMTAADSIVHHRVGRDHHRFHARSKLKNLLRLVQLTMDTFWSGAGTIKTFLKGWYCSSDSDLSVEKADSVLREWRVISEIP